MLEVEYERGASEVVYSVVIENKGYYIWREANVFSFLLVEYDLFS